MALVTAIIPAYGHEELTRKAVAELGRQTSPPAEVLVVDDGSGKPIEAIDGARIIRHTENRGFAAAVNTGVLGAQTELVAILNNDVMLAPDWLERLQAVLQGHEVSFACGKLYRPNGQLDGTFDLLSRGGLAWRAGSGRKDGPAWSKPRRIAFSSLTAILVRRADVGLDESYHSYYEDVEWSLRSAIANKIGYFEPLATGVHQGSATAGAWSRYSAQRILRNHRRLAFQYLLPTYGPQYRIARGLLRALALKHGRWPAIPPERIEPKPLSPRLDEILQESENLLFELQMTDGPDSLWRWYFQLAGRLR